MDNSKLGSSNPIMIVLKGLLMLGLIALITTLTINQVKESRYIGRPDTQRDTITITGEGKVTAVPDVGEITVSIVTENMDVNKAQEENITQFNNLVSTLKKENIDEKDLKTSGYNVNPMYDWNEGERILRGYEVTQSLQVKIRDLKNSGKVITIAGQNSVNQVSGLQFTVDDPEEYRSLAREEALSNAKQKADSLAKLMGVSLGKIVSFAESASGDVPTPIYRESLALKADAMGGGVPAPEFEAGSEDIVVVATIEYEIY